MTTSPQSSSRCDDDIVLEDVVKSGRADVNDCNRTNMNLGLCAVSEISFCDIHVYVDRIKQVANYLCSLTPDDAMVVMQSFCTYKINHAED